MKRVFLAAVLLTTGALLSTACGDDDDGADNGGGSGNGGSGGTEPTVPCNPEGDGACQNEMDCPAVESGLARDTARTCGLGCQQNADPGTCAVTCIARDADLSAECATCYAALVGCASENCLAQCGADPASATCTECQIEMGCRGNFDMCSGLTTVP